MKPGLIGAILLWLLATFALIVVFVRTPTLQYYTGGVIIALFVASLIYIFGNAVRQGNKMKEKGTVQPPPSETPQG
jgi:hypothetical protein